VRDVLDDGNKEFVVRGVEGVESFEVDDAARAGGPEEAGGVVGFEVHFGEVGAAAGLAVKEGGSVVVYDVVVYGVEGLEIVGVVGQGGGKDVVVLAYGGKLSFLGLLGIGRRVF